MSEQPNVKPEAKADPAKQDTGYRARTTAGYVSWETSIDDLVLTQDYQDITAGQAAKIAAEADRHGVAVVIEKKETEK